MSLSIEFAGVSFKNPVVASSGVITRSFYGAKKCIEAGVGGIVIKSVCHNPRSWPVPRPAIFFFDRYGCIGANTDIETGFLPVEQGVKLLNNLKPIAKKEDARLIGNINLSGVSKLNEEEAREISDIARKLEDAGAEMIEISMSCPIMSVLEHGTSFWSYMPDVDLQVKIIRTLKAEVSVPVFLKLPFEKLIKNVDKLEEAGADAHSLATRIPGTVIDIETGRPIVPLPHYYGPGEIAHTCYHLSKLALKATRPITVGGGITTSRDVIQALMCGATLGSVQTAVMRYGHKHLTEMGDGLKSFIKRKGYSSVKEIIGIAAPHVENIEEYVKFFNERLLPKEAMSITVDEATCTRCGICTNCPYGAMTIDDFPKVDLERCEFCGTCQSICPVAAITIKPKTVCRTPNL